MDIIEFTAFMGWCLAINLGVFLSFALIIIFFKKLPLSVHKKLFGLDEAFLTQAYFTYLARYKILIIFFNLVPYLVLRLAL